MTTVAFLQNQWFNDPERITALIQKHGEEYRDDITAFALFRGCKTGKVLKMVFGEEINTIVWANASPVITSEASASPPGDPKHIKSVLERHQPKIVLMFGHNAVHSVYDLVSPEVFRIIGPHPAARAVDTLPRLRSMHTKYQTVLASLKQPNNLPVGGL